MARRSIEVPFVPKLIKRVEQIITESGMTRKSIIKGDTIEAYGEAGIKKFFIVQDDILDEDKAILVVDAINQQALDIITNLVQTGLEGLYIELREQEKIEKSKEKVSNNKTIVERECFACQGKLVDLGLKNLADDIRARVMVCTECERLEFFKE